jgi:ABC-type bacteriocin/lantibiotic exporter with double-glycine peptidase domain
VTRHAAFATLALVGASGCATTAGQSRTFDPDQLDPTAGWLVATPVELVSQEGSKDCGAAALAMVAGRWGVKLNLGEALRGLEASAAAAPGAGADAGGGGSGARLGALRDLARSLGLKAFAISGARATLLHELGAGRPVIVGLHVPGGPKQVRSHYEVVVGAQPADGRFVTLDPASGWRVRDWTGLDDAWRPAGRPALVVLGAASR